MKKKESGEKSERKATISNGEKAAWHHQRNNSGFGGYRISGISISENIFSSMKREKREENGV